ncbi:MAG: hypothetical protein M3O71_21585 [Bacteroidota bacterium]|nr:hypothetical protein [Bacteroidota bacterium]
MKNKKVTYLLGAVVLVVWGLIIYRVFDAASGGDDPVAPAQVAIKKEAYNDFAIPKDTTRLLLNYPDPFKMVKRKDTSIVTVKRISHNISPAIAKPVMNWNFIQYSGYIRNPSTKKLVTMVGINGRNETLAEGQVVDQVKLLKNLRDSIKISYNGKIKFITLKPAAL